MNVKPGDIAIVINADAPSDAVGHLCEVLRFYANEKYVGLGMQPGWEVRFQHSVLSAYGFPIMEGIIPDCCLRPVSGLPMADTVDEEKPVTVDA